MYEDESMASLNEKLIRAEEVENVYLILQRYQLHTWSFNLNAQELQSYAKIFAPWKRLAIVSFSHFLKTNIVATNNIATQIISTKCTTRLF